jgi:hypothetical protein
MKVDGIGGLLEVLRRRIGSQSQRLENSKRTGHKQDVGVLHGHARITAAELEAGIRNRIRDLNPEAEDYRDSATGIFLESVLLWEFGEDLSKDEDFADLMLKMKESFTSNKDLQENMDRLIRQFSSEP